MAQESYVTKQGDTLSGIASRYGVNISDVSGYRSGNPDKIGIGENLTINTRDIPAANNINAGALAGGGVTPYATPPVVPKSGYAGLIESSMAALGAEKPEVEKGKTDITEVYNKLGGKSKEKFDLYEDEGVYEKQKAYKYLTNQITAKDLAFNRRVEKIQEENPTGQLSEGQRIAIEKAEREWAREKADLSVSAAFAKDDWVTAKSIIDDKIKAETEDLNTQLDGLKYFYTQNYNRLSQDERDLLTFQIKQVETEADEKRTLLENIGTVQLAAAKGGAPASVITGIGRAEDLTTAIAAAGQYIKKGSEGGGGSFTDTQLAKGASNAGVSLSEFATYDPDSQNTFINGDITGAREDIDSAFFYEGASGDEIKNLISDMGLPQKVQDNLLNYAQKSEKENSLETRLMTLKEEGIGRRQARTKIEDELSESGKYEVSSSVKTKINENLQKIYGRTFWQKVLPGGK